MSEPVNHETIWLLWIVVICATLCGISESVYSSKLASRVTVLEKRVAGLEARK